MVQRVLKYICITVSYGIVTWIDRRYGEIVINYGFYC